MKVFLCSIVLQGEENEIHSFTAVTFAHNKKRASSITIDEIKEKSSAQGSIAANTIEEMNDDTMRAIAELWNERQEQSDE